VGIPGRAVENQHKPVMNLEHGKLPDPVAEAIRIVLKEQDKLEERLKKLESSSGIPPHHDELEKERRKIEQELEPEEEE